MNNPPLTPREREALNLRAQGATYKQVGQSMHVTENTARQYLHRAYEKSFGPDLATALCPDPRK